MNNQLYTFLPDISLPYLIRFDEETGKVTSKQGTAPGHYAFIWPDGSPCLLVEMFLSDKSKLVKISKKDGGTIGVYASHLSQLVRYCHTNNMNFWDLYSYNIDELINQLIYEIDINGGPRRNNNTVKSIISTCISFLRWLQDNIVIDRSLVGVDTKSDRHQIKLVRKHATDKRGKKIAYEVFPDKLPDSTSLAKRPISTSNIKLLWDTLTEKKCHTMPNRKLIGKFTASQQKDHIEYIHKRRELQLYLLQATGLRPQELISIICSKNMVHLKDSKILLPTLKRRDNQRDSKRLIPIDRGIAMKIELFIHNHRSKLVERLLCSGLIKDKCDIDDVVYLNPETGKAVKPDAAYQEFRRLTVEAGILQKNCQSMFRHRFITNMVKIHLISFMDKNPLKTRHIITSDDYRTILFKVTKFTGHKNVESLFHYIDLAWEELDAFSYAYDVKTLQDRLMSIYHSLNTMKSDIYSKKKISNNNLIKLVTDNIDAIANLTLLSAGTDES